MTKKLKDFKYIRHAIPDWGLEITKGSKWQRHEKMTITLCGTCGKVVNNRLISILHFWIQAFFPNDHHSMDGERRHQRKSLFEDRD
jgi:hypothetical protein